MKIFWFVTAILILAIIVVPNKLRYLVDRFFFTMITPLRELARLCRNYVECCPVRCQNLLASGGLTSPPYAVKSVGIVFIFFITMVSVLADLDLIILTFKGMTLEANNEVSATAFTGANPSVLLAITLMGGAGMLGLIIFDYFVQGMLPNFLVNNKKMTKSLMIGSSVLLVGALIAVALLGYLRAQSLGQSDADIAQILGSGKNAIEIDSDFFHSPYTVEIFLFIFISCLSLINGILGILVFPAFGMLLMCGMLLVLDIPIGILYFVSFTADSILSRFYRTLIAGLNVVCGLTKPLNNLLGKYFDDT